jgi:hypothetical protein
VGKAEFTVMRVMEGKRPKRRWVYLSLLNYSDSTFISSSDSR